MEVLLLGVEGDVAMDELCGSGKRRPVVEDGCCGRSKAARLVAVAS